ncbi:MAG: GNAT family N-acetyltransferase [Bacteroidota bacterium]|nr:GNAT family N-acetyltransferase [Bacteroidota bacterium]
MIRLLTTYDFKAWLKIAGEVEPLFGPMVHSKGFHFGIRQCIRKHNAFGIEDETNEIAGIIAIDRKKNEILWLAVREKSRGKKYGETLLRKAIEELDNKKEIIVQTFAEGVKGGTIARILYEKNGFTDQISMGKNPAGLETVRMVRKESL